MRDAFAILAWSASTPLVLIYLYLLLDQWHLSRRGQTVIGVLSFLVSAAVLLPLPANYYYFAMPVVYLALFAVTRHYCAAGNCRFLFLFLSALLFSALCAALCQVLSAVLPVPVLLLRIPVDGGFLLLCLNFFRPALRSIHRVVPQRWGLLIPVPLCSILALYLLVYRFPGSYLALCGLLLLVLATYALFSVLLFSLRQRHEGAIDSAMLRTQYETLSLLAQERSSREHQWRILRHDLRHYALLLDSSLEHDDIPGVLALIATMRDQLPPVADKERTP